MKYLITFLWLLVLSCSAKADNSMPVIKGSFAFPVEGNQIVVRTSIRPPQRMTDMTVVICAGGHCEFAKPNVGLGFYEAKFKTPKLLAGNRLSTLVVACSHTGCAKASLVAKVMQPKDKF